ncbi:hypothetical protein [Microbacterium sp.]|uniref:hypothetical protein n=1 Tax=Microbacterium sp. TaxID=51671 RepID=UPI0037C7671F
MFPEDAHLDRLGETPTVADPWATGDLGADMFSSEIANVDASDWDVDTDLIWGDDGDPADDGGAFDLPV